ncbi:hypothetical protein JCM8097_003812 [Rhodosporidiobolus ruineniae]
MLKHQVVVGTHSDSIHLVEFDPAVPSLVVLHSLCLREQPSTVTLSPSIPGLFYANSWTDDRLYAIQLSEEKGFEVKSETAAGGGGPTHFVVNGDALLAVNYRGGSIVRHPLTDDGLFSSPSPAPNRIFSFPYRHATPPHSRQESSHPHQLIRHGENWLIPDLGTDTLWEMRWSGGNEGKWELVGEHGVAPQSGPRHGVKHPSEPLLYLVNEVGASASVHNLPSAVSTSPVSVAPSTSAPSPPSPPLPSLLPALSTYTVLPPRLQNVPRIDGYDRIPATILFLSPLPNSPPDSPSTLFVSNRNSPAHLSPDGDSFVQYTVPPADPTKLVDPVFHLGAGHHS